MRESGGRLRIGFIGTGNMAGHHQQALRRVPTSHEVVGVYDARATAAQEFARRAGARVFATLAALLEDARPDLVHICTPAGSHFEPARAALLGGAHIYVEKPCVETLAEAEVLFELARERGLLICSGHQLLRDPAYARLMRDAAQLGPFTHVDSYFAFRPPRLDPAHAAHGALARQLLDILPHPLYSLVAALEQCAQDRGGDGAPIEIAHVTATPTDLHTLLRLGGVTGRLAVSLRARPVASTLSVTGATGTLTADFVRSIVLGAANEGTSPVEKIANPFLEAAQLAWRNTTSLVQRFTHGADYPGLVELLADFYAAAAAAAGDGHRTASPVSVNHLRRVTTVYEQLAEHVRDAVAPEPSDAAGTRVGARSGPVAVLTGASGFFGRAIGRELSRRGFRVRGISRSARPDNPHVDEWVRADLGDGMSPEVLADAAVVVHAAAETAGGFAAHERNTVGATRELLRAMTAAGVRRLVYISSISVLRPPRRFWERQGEDTPLAPRAERLGPYTWGKCVAEELVAAARAQGAIEARILRPAALLDWHNLELPGLLGRRLFGRWHLGLGRPGLPFAVCDVSAAGAAVAWCAERFDEAPALVNLMDPTIRTRGQLLSRFRASGWRGRILWAPISVLAGAIHAARFGLGLMRRERPQPLAAWSILRSRRYDASLSSKVLAGASDSAPRAHAAMHHRQRTSPPTVSQVHG